MSVQTNNAVQRTDNLIVTVHRTINLYVDHLPFNSAKHLTRHKQSSAQGSELSATCKHRFNQICKRKIIYYNIAVHSTILFILTNE